MLLVPPFVVAVEKVASFSIDLYLYSQAVKLTSQVPHGELLQKIEINMPAKRGEKRTKPVVVSGSTNSHKNAQKEIAIIETLHKAETQQLSSFIKNRSKEL